MSEREEIAKRIYWTQHAIMHDHDKLWRECEKQFIYFECADHIIEYLRRSQAEYPQPIAFASEEDAKAYVEASFEVPRSQAENEETLTYDDGLAEGIRLGMERSKQREENDKNRDSNKDVNE